MIKAIKCYAWRNDAGPTGGPGGVLWLMRQYLGHEYNGIEIQYKFKPKKSSFYEGAFKHVLTREVFRFDKYYICHDIATAAALSLLNKNYTLIFHQQGPIIDEITNFGTRLGRKRRWFLQWIERRAFTLAKSVHFPSEGAQSMYFDSPNATTKRENVTIGEALFNTIADVKYPTANKDLRPDILTFVSVGTITSAKGQDNAVEFLSALLSQYSEKIRWILIGKGVLQTHVINKAYSLMSKYKNFYFNYIESIPNREVRKILSESDVYLMCQRISIFDLASLEAMCAGNPISEGEGMALVLSDVGGNRDINKEDNIVMVRENDFDGAAKNFLSRDLREMKKKNRKIFNDYFSPVCFVKNYQRLFDNILNGKLT